MFQIFEDENDVIRGQISTISSGMWSEGKGNLNDTTGGGMHSSSAQSSSTGDYFVEVYNKAVSDTSGDVNLYLAEDGIVGHRIYNSKKFNKSVKVQKIVLDDYFSKLQLLDKINFVKIDV